MNMTMMMMMIAPVFSVTECKNFICPPYDVNFQKGIILKEHCLIFGKLWMMSSLSTLAVLLLEFVVTSNAISLAHDTMKIAHLDLKFKWGHTNTYAFISLNIFLCRWEVGLKGIRV